MWIKKLRISSWVIASVLMYIKMLNSLKDVGEETTTVVDNSSHDPLKLY